jgi:hypothetical protein
MKKVLFFLFVQLILHPVNAQLTVSMAMTPAQLVQNVLAQNGVVVSNVTYSGITGSIGKFQTGTSPTNLGLAEGIIMSTGLVNGSPAIGSPGTDFASDQNGSGSDPDLQALINGDTIRDAAALQFDFITMADTIKFRYVFGSEEYPEYVCSQFTDVFGFFVSGPNPLGGSYSNYNIALIPDTNLPVAINSINSGVPGGSFTGSDCISLSYSQYYVNNGPGASIVYDGFTTVLTAWCLVQPCTQYHIKIAIGDAGDASFDSGVFLEAHSFFTGNIYSPPQINTDPSNHVACTGGNGDFQISASSQDSLYYQWQVNTNSGNNWVDITTPDTMPVYSGYASDHLTLTNIPDTCDGFLYRCLVSDCSCMPSIPSANAKLIVTNTPPLTGSITGDTGVCQGQGGVIYSIPYNLYASGYIWTSPYGSNIIGNYNTININYSDTAISGDVTVYEINDCGTGNTQTLHIVVHPKPPIPVITQNGTTLISSSGVAYQWWINGHIINGAIAQTITMLYPGNYQVQIWDSYGCSSFSDTIYWSGLDEQIKEKSLNIYPNPANGQITIDYTGFEDANLYFYSIEGKLLLQQPLYPDKTIIDISNFEKGVYIIKVLNIDINVTIKIIKE